jgi:hypothetical protein
VREIGEIEKLGRRGTNDVAVTSTDVYDPKFSSRRSTKQLFARRTKL